MFVGVIVYVAKPCNCPVVTTDPTPTPSVIPTATPTPLATPTPSVKPTLSPEQVEEIFTNQNVYGVQNGPTNPTVFTITQSRQLFAIENYHWNSGQGKKLGTISLEAEDGTTYGPWQAVGRDGQGGAPNAYWTVYPDLELPAGTYTIIDSDNFTWSQNAQSGNQGMTRVYAVKG